MSKYINYFLVCTILLLTQCRSNVNNEQDLLGTWQIENIEMNQKLTESEKANFDLYLSQLKESAFFTFTKDHHYNSFFNDEPSNGEWALTENRKGLITKQADSDADTAKIERLSSIDFIIVSESEGIKTKIIMRKKK